MTTKDRMYDMGKTLVLTEKPSVGREVAKILNCHQKGNGCFVGPKYIVVWALGHLGNVGRTRSL